MIDTPEAISKLTMFIDARFKTFFTVVPGGRHLCV